MNNLTVELLQERLEEQDAKFYRRLAKVRKANGNASETDVKQIRDTLESAFLQETGFKVYPPFRLDTRIPHLRDLGEISVEAAYEMIKTPKVILANDEICEGKELFATAMPETGIESPEFQCCGLYHAIELNRIESESQMSAKRKEIDRANIQLEQISEMRIRMKTDLDEKVESVLRKKNLPPNKRKSTGALEIEIEGIQEKLGTLESQRDNAEGIIGSSQRDIVEYAAKLEAGTVTFLYQLSEQAKVAGLEDLALNSEMAAVSRENHIMDRVKNMTHLVETFETNKGVARAMIKRYRNPENKELVDFAKGYKKMVVFEFDYTIQPEERKGYWNQINDMIWWKRAVGIGVIIAIGAMFVKEYIAVNHKKSPAEQFDIDYQRFRDGKLTLEEIDQRYAEDTPESRKLNRNLMNDRYITNGNEYFEKIQVEKVAKDGIRTYDFRVPQTGLWRKMRIEEQSKKEVRIAVPLFPSGTKAGEYLMRERTRHEDNSWVEKKHMVGANEIGETTYVRNLTEEEKIEFKENQRLRSMGVLFEYFSVPDNEWIIMAVAYTNKKDQRPLKFIVKDMLNVQTLHFKQKSEPGNYTVRAVSQEGEIYPMKVKLKEDRTTNWKFPVAKQLRSPLEKLANEITPGFDYEIEFKQAYATSMPWKKMTIDARTKIPSFPEPTVPGMYRLMVTEKLGSGDIERKTYEAMVSVDGNVEFINRVYSHEPSPFFPRIPGVPKPSISPEALRKMPGF